MTTEYKKALDKVNEHISYCNRQLENTWILNNDNEKIENIKEAILFHNTLSNAMRIAHALMQEPSEEMRIAAIESYNQNGNFALVSHFKAMRDQMLKEALNESKK